MNLLKQLALCPGIAIILPMTVYYGVDTVSPAPKFSDIKSKIKDYDSILAHGTDEQKKAARSRQSLAPSLETD